MVFDERFQQAIDNIIIPENKTFLVTGCAGFIGSHLTETLLKLGQKVIGFDNFATGSRDNISAVLNDVGDPQSGLFEFVEGDIRDGELCATLVKRSDYVINLAALGSVPRSIANPEDSITTNIMGFFNLLEAVKNSPETRLIFASSSSIYGNNPDLPKKDGQYGNVLSPYAASKRADELLAESFQNCFKMEVIGLRFFNVFGERQNPKGPYAAVIPRWTTAMLSSEEKCVIFGDGKTSRDFTFVYNVVYGILLACTTQNDGAFGKTLNLACGSSTSLNDLFYMLRDSIGSLQPKVQGAEPTFEDFRLGDIRHSTADISLIKELLNYSPIYSVPEGLNLSANGFIKQYG